MTEMAYANNVGDPTTRVALTAAINNCVNNVNNVDVPFVSVALTHREIKVRDRITSFPPCTTMSQKIDKEIRISLSMS